MKTKTSLLILTLATALGFSAPLAAKKGSDADDLSCTYGSGMLSCNWNGVGDANAFSASSSTPNSYRWEITAEYDVDGDDGVVDRKKKFHMGSSGPSLVISTSSMRASFYDDDNGSVVSAMPVSAKVRVKTMYFEMDHDKGKGHAKGGKGKNSPYSDRIEVAFSEPEWVPPPCAFCQ